MSQRFSDARVLVTAVFEDDEPDETETTARVAADLRDELGVETVVRRGRTAFEYVREFAPLLDCVVCLADDSTCPEVLADVEPGLPLVVYGSVAPPTPVDSVVRRDGGTDALMTRVADRITRSRERNRLAEANAKLTALNRYTRGITGCETRETVVDTVVETVTGALAYEHCVLGFVEGGVIVPHGNTIPGMDVERLNVDEGVAGRTYRTGETTITDDYHADPARRREDERVQSVVSVAVGDHGVLQITAPEREAFDERDAEFLEIVASHASEALSRLERETALRAERDRLHAFFEGLPAPTVYIESERGEPPVLREANAAYEAAFPATPLGDPVADAFPTGTERRLFGESIRADDPVTELVRRDTVASTDAALSVTLVPVRTAGLAAAGFGVYVSDVTLP